MAGSTRITPVQPEAESVDKLEHSVRAALTEVYDPEIPTLSVSDLGMVQAVRCVAGVAEISITPTFVGCPALSLIKGQIERRVQEVPGICSVHVAFVYDEPWTSDKITEQGRQRLKQFGIAPPACSLVSMQRLAAPCPYCGSDNTTVENVFGPTACRSLFYCNDCRQPFEGMKPV